MENLIQDQMRHPIIGHQHMFHILYHGVITAPPKITGLDMIPAIDIEDFPFVESSKIIFSVRASKYLSKFFIRSLTNQSF